MAKQQKVPVSRRALIARVNRKLALDERVLKAPRGDRAKDDLGEFYILDWRKNSAIAGHLDLEHTAKELGCLAEWEELSA